MRIKCNFCDAADRGTQAELQDKGWSKAIFFTPVRKTIVTCPLHYNDFNLAVMKIMKPIERKKDVPHKSMSLHDDFELGSG